MFSFWSAPGVSRRRSCDVSTSRPVEEAGTLSSSGCSPALYAYFPTLVKARSSFRIICWVCLVRFRRVVCVCVRVRVIGACAVSGGNPGLAIYLAWVSRLTKRPFQ